jgi:hypothetical protein
VWIFVDYYTLLHIVALYSSAQNLYDLFQQKVLVLFLEFFIGPRSLNLTVEKIKQVQVDGIAFMESAKATFPI